MKLLVFGILALHASKTNGDMLLSIVKSSRPATLGCCANSVALSCNLVNVNPSAMGQQELTLPGDITVPFLNMVANDLNAYHYGSKDADVILTYNPESNGLHGHAMMTDGRSFVIENCGGQGHVWKQLDNAKFGDGIAVPVNKQTATRANNDALVQRGASDNTTMVTISVKFYYTPQFAAVTNDINGYVNQAIAETNQGYINSKVPITVVKCGVELATINDIPSSSTLLNNFSTMKSTLADVRGGADMAAILVNDFDSCGVGYFNSFPNGNTLVAATKGCAVGYYSLGHEIGHNFGLTHNAEVSTNSVYKYGYGKLIDKGTAATGVRTIMAYPATGHTQRVNYYSNPSVIYPGTRTSTGATLANNAAVLLLNRFSVSQIGKETTCSAITVSTTVKTTTKPTTTGTFTKPTPTTARTPTTTAKPTSRRPSKL